MDINRNQYFMVGLIVLFLGVQFRYVDSFTLNDRTTQFLSERINQAQSSPGVLRAAGPPIGKTYNPPEWMGWALMSVGGVLILHSLAMKRPD